MFMTICWNGRQNGYFDKTAGMENFVVLYIYIYCCRNRNCWNEPVQNKGVSYSEINTKSSF